MSLLNEDNKSLIFYYQSKIPVSLFEIALALGIKVERDKNDPIKKAGKGMSCARLVFYPNPHIYYQPHIGSSQKIKFVVAAVLAYYLLYKDMMVKKLPYGECESVFYDNLWNKELSKRNERKKALRYAVDILVPPHMLIKVFKDNMYGNNLEKIAQYFDVQPSLISIATGFPYES